MCNWLDKVKLFLNQKTSQNKKNTKTFKDLVFEPSEAPLNGIRATIDFDNGYGVSVIKNAFSYGGPSVSMNLQLLKMGKLIMIIQLPMEMLLDGLMRKRFRIID